MDSILNSNDTAMVSHATESARELGPATTLSIAPLTVRLPAISSRPRAIPSVKGESSAANTSLSSYPVAFSPAGGPGSAVGSYQSGAGSFSGTGGVSPSLHGAAPVSLFQPGSRPSAPVAMPGRPQQIGGISSSHYGAGSAGGISPAADVGGCMGFRACSLPIAHTAIQRALGTSPGQQAQALPPRPPFRGSPAPSSRLSGAQGSQAGCTPSSFAYSPSSVGRGAVPFQHLPGAAEGGARGPVTPLSTSGGGGLSMSMPGSKAMAIPASTHGSVAASTLNAFMALSPGDARYAFPECLKRIYSSSCDRTLSLELCLYAAACTQMSTSLSISSTLVCIHLINRP